MDKSSSNQESTSLQELLRELAKETKTITAVSATEVTYEQLVTYFERRSSYFASIEACDWSEAEKEACVPYVQQILAADPKLQEMMSRFKQEAAKELEQIYGARKQQAGYEHQVQLQQPMESLFFDQKK